MGSPSVSLGAGCHHLPPLYPQAVPTGAPGTLAPGSAVKDFKCQVPDSVEPGGTQERIFNKFPSNSFYALQV